MATPAKKQSFLGGAAILTAAVVIVKLIGAAYKIPLSNILGSAGQTYFDTAYQIYNFLLTFSTAGLPLAISRMTSQAHAQGLENEKRKIFRTSIWLFFGLGLVCSVLMFFRADALARFLNNSLASTAVQALAPAVFCVCLLACMRGYTQGQGNMTPTAISQVLEALLKLGIGLPLAWYVLHIGLTAELSAAGAIVGVTAGTAISMLFLFAYLATHKNRKESLDVPSTSGQIIKQILLIGVPITLSNSAMSIINIIDTKIVMGRLQNGLGLAEEAAAVLNGQYRIAMNMPNMVASFVYPVTMSLIPFAAAALARKDHTEADRIISSAFRLIAILALPAGVGLSVLSTPIEILMLPMQPEDALAAGPHLQILGIALIFICLMILTNAILQTYGKEKLPIFTVIAGGVVLVLAHRGKEMRFVVGCETRALPVKDVGGVVHAPAAPVGDRAGDDVHVQLAGERRAQRLHRLAAAVAPLRQMVGGEEAGVPSFRQQRGVRALRRRAAQQRLRVREIIGALTQTHIHLNDAQPHAQTSLNLVRTGSNAHAPAL